MKTISEIRPSPIAGYWYSGNPNILRGEILSFLENVELPSLNGDVIGIMVPHAGYRYSGQTAAYGFRSVLGQNFDLVVILSPFHAYSPASILTSAHSYYETPLGKIEVDQSLIDLLMKKLEEKPPIRMTKIANDEEHSLEIELPFLQTVLSQDFLLFPLMIRSVDSDITEFIALELASIIKDKKVLIVCSTDLSHFYPQRIAKQLDKEMLKQIEAFSSENIYLTEAKGRGFACGLGAVMVGVNTCKHLGADSVKILHHATSGDITGDSSSVVGYGAVAFLRSNN